MSVLDKILEEIDNRKSYHEEKLYQRDDYEIQKMYCDEELDWITNIIRSHMDKSLNDEKCSGNNYVFVAKNMTVEQFKELTKNQNSFKKAMERLNRNEGCMVYEIDSNVMEDIKPASREFLEECAETARKYKRNTEDNNKCSDCSRRKWYQIGYKDGENINIEKIKAINKEMEDYLFEKYCIEGFDEVLDGIFKKYLDLDKETDVIANDGWIPVEERLPNQNDVYNVTRLIGGGFISDSAYFDGQDTWHNDNRINHARPYLTDIVAWKSLPKEYKPNKQD